MVWRRQGQSNSYSANTTMVQTVASRIQTHPQTIKNIYLYQAVAYKLKIKTPEQNVLLTWWTLATSLSRPPRLTSTNNHWHKPDQLVNKMVKEQVHLFPSSGLYTVWYELIIGKMKRDSLGWSTYSSALGISAVDYAISETSPSLISAFTVVSILNQVFIR